MIVESGEVGGEEREEVAVGNQLMEVGVGSVGVVVDGEGLQVSCGLCIESCEEVIKGMVLVFVLTFESGDICIVQVAVEDEGAKCGIGGIDLSELLQVGYEITDDPLGVAPSEELIFLGFVYPHHLIFI